MPTGVPSYKVKGVTPSEKTIGSTILSQKISSFQSSTVNSILAFAVPPKRRFASGFRFMLQVTPPTTLVVSNVKFVEVREYAIVTLPYISMIWKVQSVKSPLDVGY